MTHARVFVKRIISSNGKAVTEAKSIVITSDEQENTVHQTVNVNVASSNNNFSSSSSSTSAVADKKPKE